MLCTFLGPLSNFGKPLSSFFPIKAVHFLGKSGSHIQRPILLWNDNTQSTWCQCLVKIYYEICVIFVSVSILIKSARNLIFLQCVHIHHFFSLSILLISKPIYCLYSNFLSFSFGMIWKKICYNLLLHARIVSVGYIWTYLKIFYRGSLQLYSLHYWW